MTELSLVLSIELWHEQDALPKLTPRTFTAKDFKSLKLLRRFRTGLEGVIEAHPELVHRSFTDPKRRLLLGDYLSYYLLALFNPVARTPPGAGQSQPLAPVTNDARCGAGELGQLFGSPSFGE